MTEREEKWSKGPWNIAVAQNGDHAILMGQNHILAECFVAIRRAEETAFSECEANAHLIAAAPALYEALVTAKKTIRAFHDLPMPPESRDSVWEAYQHSPEMKQINAALSQARGETGEETPSLQGETE